jgi:hypothetical protein
MPKNIHGSLIVVLRRHSFWLENIELRSKGKKNGFDITWCFALKAYPHIKLILQKSYLMGIYIRT